MELVGISRVAIEGSLAVISALVLFSGSVWLLLSAVFGVRLGYLVMATAFFGFMIVISTLWAFGAPGTPAYLGPKGELPHWVALGAGVELSAPDFPVLERYPGGRWRSAADDPSLSAEVEAAGLTFQEFLAEEAMAALEGEGAGAEIPPETFRIEDLRFTDVDGVPIAAARAFATTGGPEVLVVGFKDQGNEPLPSFLFLGGSVLGFALHLPFLDRAERQRKEILTGGEQQPWRGPA